MLKFEAAKQFVTYLQSNPADFGALRDSGRDHDIYTVHHKYREVSISIDVKDGMMSVNTSKKGSINFVSGDDQRAVLDWAKLRIQADKEQQLIDNDNRHSYELFKYYTER